MTLARDTAPPGLPPAAAERRPFRDNPRLVLLGILLLIAALVAMVTLADRSTELNPDFLSEVVLYAVSAADLTMLVVLVFVLARNIVKLIVERRRGLPFSRFRAKLVLAMLGLTIVPSVLVLIVGGELIRSSTERWLRVPIDDVLRLSTQIAGDYYREREARVEVDAARIAAALPAVGGWQRRCARRFVARSASEVTRGASRARRGLSRPARAPAASPPCLRLLRSNRQTLSATADTRSGGPAGLAGPGGIADPAVLRAARGGQRAGASRRRRFETEMGQSSAWWSPAIICPGQLATHARRITEAYEKYNEIAVMKRPLQGIYLSLFLTMTLMILVSATWTGLYLAKRITRPVQRLAAGAREIGAGHLDHRIEPETRDEFGSLVEAFNTMAGGLAASQQKLEHSRLDLEQKNLQLDERRRYIETVLERIATGVVSLGADGRIETINSAALRLLDVDGRVIGSPGRRLVPARRPASARAPPAPCA